MADPKMWELDEARLNSDLEKFEAHLTMLEERSSFLAMNLPISLEETKQALNENIEKLNHATGEEKIALEKQVQSLTSQYGQLEYEIDSMNRLHSKLVNGVEILHRSVKNFTHDLKALCDTKGMDEEKRKNYEKSYNAMVDGLVQIEGFSRNKNLEEMKKATGLWSKIHQRYAYMITNKNEVLTLEGSLAGSLLDGKSWGTTWSVDPDAPLKQMWLRMSREIAEAAKGKAVEVHVFQHVVKESAFYTDEWPKIKEGIAKGEIEALHLYIHKRDEESEKAQWEKVEKMMKSDIYILEKIPGPEELKKETYENAHIFTKDPPALYRVKDGKADLFPVGEQFSQELPALLGKVDARTDPISKETIGNDKYPELSRLQRMILHHPDYSTEPILKKDRLIVIKTQDDLERYIKVQDASYRASQQQWQDKQTTLGRWDMLAQKAKSHEIPGMVFEEKAKVMTSAGQKPEIQEAKITASPKVAMQEAKITANPKVETQEAKITANPKVAMQEAKITASKKTPSPASTSSIFKSLVSGKNVSVKETIKKFELPKKEAATTKKPEIKKVSQDFVSEIKKKFEPEEPAPSTPRFGKR